MGKQVRLQKLLASRGIASRRKCEEIIAEQRVTVNDVIAKVGASVDPNKDRVKLDGRTLPAPPPVAYYLLYKPRGQVTTRSDESGRKTIFDDLGRLEAGIQAVGRLDLNTEGALLLTNDGDVANELAHSKNQVPKKYLVKVYRQPSGHSLRLISEGRVYLDGVPTKPAN